MRIRGLVKEGSDEVQISSYNHRDIEYSMGNINSNIVMVVCKARQMLIKESL